MRPTASIGYCRLIHHLSVRSLWVDAEDEGVRVADGRTERWVAHRAEVRSKLVDSAMRAIDVLGPQVSMREIAAEAKIPKATLYRFFTDKSELAAAIADRVRDMVAERITVGPTEAGATLGGFLRSGVSRFLELADGHPNIFQFVMVTYSETPEEPSADLDRVSAPSRDLAAVLRQVMLGCGGTGTDLELTAYMVIGSILHAGKWWLVRGHEDEKTLVEVIDNVDSSIRALVQTAAHANGVHLDFDAPMANYFGKTGLVRAM